MLRGPTGLEIPPGHRLFAQYAYAPNALGYCGPSGSAGLAAVACGHGVDEQGASVDVAALARRFSGAWPYQEILAELAGITDPLDERVVRGYWTGNELTDRTDRVRFGQTLLARLGAAAGHYWKHLTEELLVEAAPTHTFHVLGVYPWSRLLGTGMPQPLHVLDSCRIRWGTVVEVRAETAIVRSRRLLFDGCRLSLGPERDESTRYRTEAGVFVPDLRVGDRVAVHWNFVCDRLTRAETERLEWWTAWQLERTNPRL